MMLNEYVKTTKNLYEAFTKTLTLKAYLRSLLRRKCISIDTYEAENSRLTAAEIRNLFGITR
jgi:hypothetical protein